ncbi:hypothetical protein EHYA_02340 [Embleya hyalina]|uniref:Uncharacterized protein n=1 Tax=Embleya hyalina TaxID=516124 RepID=A0A401YJ98_9ACTN|nr:hypothetical protein EHYA_02340 [Embleya hyalina]
MALLKVYPVVRKAAMIKGAPTGEPSQPMGTFALT